MLGPWDRRVEVGQAGEIEQDKVRKSESRARLEAARKAEGENRARHDRTSPFYSRNRRFEELNVESRS